MQGQGDAAHLQSLLLAQQLQQQQQQQQQSQLVQAGSFQLALQLQQLLQSAQQDLSGELFLPCLLPWLHRPAHQYAEHLFLLTAIVQSATPCCRLHNATCVK